ncbi:hypothetical protein ACFLQG_01770, partial [Candidatus Zixiibacteriota bacterium]
MKHLKSILTICMLLLAISLFAQNATAQVSCCQGIRGNFDGDPGDAIDIADLVYMVDYQFAEPPGSNPAPPCFEEGDIAPIESPDGGIDIGDLVAMVDYQFAEPPGTGPPPPACLVFPQNVFTDDYGYTVTYEAFDGSYYDAVQVSEVEAHVGTKSLEITIPSVAPWWSGGALTADPRNLTVYNALTFWAKASIAAPLNEAGVGNDNTVTAKYQAKVVNLALTTEWQKFVIPIPLAEKWIAEDGLFFFAEGSEGPDHMIWMDEIIFENLGTITNPRPVIHTMTLDVAQDDDVVITGANVTFDVDGTDITVSAMMGYFSFISSDPSVVLVDGETITAVGAGTATLTAELGSAKAPTPAVGEVTVNVAPPEPVPTVSAPTPTHDPGDVVALLSDDYTEHPVSTWSANWPDDADVEDYVIGSDNTKKYTNLVYAGIQFESPTVDASAKTHFHMDVWTPNATDAPAVYKVKLVDFGADGVWGTDDTEFELVFDHNTMSSETWVSIDVPLASFSGMNTGHIAQMIIATDGTIPTVYVDNIYFYDSGLPTAPLVAAPTPTIDESYVISLYSDAYTDETVDTWLAGWSSGSVSDETVESDNMKKYSGLGWAGIEFTSSPIDATGMTHFHMDVWTPIPTDAPAEYRVKLVDAGADGTVGTGSDDTEYQLIFDENTMNTGSWVSIDVPLTDFVGMNTGHLAQMVIEGLATVYVDNIYFYSPPPTEPTSSAPTPTPAQVDVISLFSDSYTDVTIDTYCAGWSHASVSDFILGGTDNMKEYTLVW